MRARTIWAAALLCLAVQGLGARAAFSAPGAGLGAQLSLAVADSDQIFPGGFEQLFTLSITNYLDWCSISVNYGPAAADDPIDSFEQGRAIALHGDTSNASFFDWGFWTGTDAADLDTNKDTNMDATVTMSSDRNITVCCPDVGLPSCP
ncbi:MAG TPA: hypothetical protein VGH81_08415 [Rudaea sp.]|jgi:hypothetical protein